MVAPPVGDVVVGGLNKLKLVAAAQGAATVGSPTPKSQDAASSTGARYEAEGDNLAKCVTVAIMYFSPILILISMAFHFPTAN